MLLQSPNILGRVSIRVMELKELRDKIEEQQKNTNNSEIVRTAGARLEEELRPLKLEGQKLHEQLLQTKQIAFKQWELAGVLQKSS